MKAVPTEIQNQVLAFAVEDYFGLYEIIWAMNEKWPELEEPKKNELARVALKSLLQNGLIRLYRLELQGKEPTPVPAEEASSLADDPESWQPGRSYIGFAATDKGEEAYFTSSKNA